MFEHKFIVCQSLALVANFLSNSVNMDEHVPGTPSRVVLAPKITLICENLPCTFVQFFCLAIKISKPSLFKIAQIFGVVIYTLVNKTTESI